MFRLRRMHPAAAQKRRTPASKPIRTRILQEQLDTCSREWRSLQKSGACLPQLQAAPGPSQMERSCGTFRFERSLTVGGQCKTARPRMHSRGQSQPPALSCSLWRAAARRVTPHKSRSSRYIALLISTSHARHLKLLTLLVVIQPHCLHLQNRGDSGSARSAAGMEVSSTSSAAVNDGLSAASTSEAGFSAGAGQG